MGAIIGERSKEERPDHFVRVIPTAGGDWIALCSDCSFEETTHLKVDAEMNADIHRSLRNDGSGTTTTGRHKPKLRRKMR